LNSRQLVARASPSIHPSIHRRRVASSSSRTSIGLATARSRLGNGLNSSSSLESSLMTIIGANRSTARVEE
jgi:hypothetical protein